MKFNFATIILGFICFACQKEKYPTEYINVQNTSIQHTNTDTFLIHEVHYPGAIYEYSQWLIFPHTEKTGDFPIYAYQKTDLEFAFQWGKFGRGPNEIHDCNNYYFEKTDSSFFLNTNYIYETEFVENDNNLEIRKKEIIAPYPMNNLLKINDSLFFFENLLQEYEFSIYDSKKQRIIKQFSQYPISKDIYYTEDNRDNLCRKSCVIKPSKDFICAFYENLPLIRLYNTQGEVLKEIRLQNHPFQINLSDYENNESILYFSYPYATEKYIYVQFFNKPLNKYYQTQQTEIQRWKWDLTLDKRFLIDKYFDIFCIDGQADILYGVNQRNTNSYFVKTVLK